MLLVMILLSLNAYAYIDPFVSPVEPLKKVKKINFSKKKPEIFKNVKVFNLNEYILEGVIGSPSKYKLVLKDPETGKIYTLSEGTPIDVNIIIQKISRKYILLKEYYYTKTGKVESRYRKVKIGPEELK